jgi:hypothetical protein
MTILASEDLKRQKTNPLLPRYNEESQKTTFWQAKTVPTYSKPHFRGAKQAKSTGPGFIWALLFNLWRFKE